MKDKKTTTRAIGYVRVSGAFQATHGASLDAQRDGIEEYCKNNDIELLRPIIEDAGVSGKEWNARPGIQKLERMVKAGEANMVVCKSLSRLGRNTRELLRIVEELQGVGCKFKFLSESIDTTTPSGRAMLAMLAAFAQMELEQTLERTSTGKAKKKAMGVVVSIAPVYGYEYIEGDKQGNGRTFTVNPAEAAVVRRMVTMAMDGVSLNKIALALNNDGIPCRQNKRWSATAIGTLLANPVVYGKFYNHRYEYLPGKDKGKGVKRGVKRILRPRSEWELTMTLDESIIDQSTYDAIQTKIKDRRKPRNVKRNSPYLLRDILHCQTCAGDENDRVPFSRMVPSNGARPQDRYYACFWKRTSKAKLVSAGRERCSMPYIPAVEVESIMWGFAKSVFLKPEVLIRHLGDTSQLKGELDKGRGALTVLRRKLTKVDRDELAAGQRLAEGETPPHVAKRLFATYAANRERLSEQVVEAEHRVQGLERAEQNFAAMQEALADLPRVTKAAEAMLDGLGNDDKRDLIRACTGEATLVVSEQLRWFSIERPESWGNVKGSGEVARAIRNINAATRPFSDRVNRVVGRRKDHRGRPTITHWAVDLVGEIDCGRVVTDLGRFAQKLRGTLGEDSDAIADSTNDTGYAWPAWSCPTPEGR